MVSSLMGFNVYWKQTYRQNYVVSKLIYHCHLLTFEWCCIGWNSLHGIKSKKMLSNIIYKHTFFSFSLFSHLSKQQQISCVQYLQWKIFRKPLELTRTVNIQYKGPIQLMFRLPSILWSLIYYYCMALPVET